MKQRVLLFLALSTLSAWAIPPEDKKLPIGLAPGERPVRRGEPRVRGIVPEGPIRSLGEWEEADAVMTLWKNPSLVRALTQRGSVRLIADTENDKRGWQSWLSSNQIPATNVDYFIVNTDSIWIRDYGPWFILDGRGNFGAVDTIYNRPRPSDDRVPAFIAKTLGLPLYETGLVHTGGNYYSDGQGNAFSSTLVYSENENLTSTEIEKRMLNFLGIGRYSTSRLSPGTTIQHLDTFGKLVAPDTWVFSEFPTNSIHRGDSEAMVRLLQTVQSPYGTPYKIYRMKMVSLGGNEAYRAYINAFISNRVLYYPTYGNDAADQAAKQVYQTALPGYEIVGVDAEGTEWGDSVHCRNRNLLKAKTLRLFPALLGAPKAGVSLPVELEVFTPDDTVLANAPLLHWTLDGKPQEDLFFAWNHGRVYVSAFPALAPGAKVRFWVEATDSLGNQRQVPPAAPNQGIDFTAG